MRQVTFNTGKHLQHMEQIRCHLNSVFMKEAQLIPRLVKTAQQYKEHCCILGLCYLGAEMITTEIQMINIKDNSVSDTVSTN